MKQLKRFLVITNELKPETEPCAKRLMEYISGKGCFSKHVSNEDDYENGKIKPELLTANDCIIVLGGDGTMLKVAHAVSPCEIPVIGINFGTIGFLTGVSEARIIEMADRLISGDYLIEDRMMLSGSVNGEVHDALNDIVISRTRIIKLIALKIFVNDMFFDEYEADGVIVSTPTGSTGYNLSAGGPIASPKSNLIILTPLAPYSLSKKSVVLDPGDRIRICLLEKRKLQESHATVAFDGNENIDIEADDTVDISVSAHTLKLISFGNVNFYERLRKKIGI